jgi:hypothetical protein
MAARLRKTHQDDVRAKIQASQLVNVLQNHALGISEGELSQTRLKAIEILLRKSVPDLSAVTLTGEDGGPVQVEKIIREVMDPKAK